MNGEKRVEDLRIIGARVLVFDHLNHAPDGGFMGIAGLKSMAVEAPAKAFAEAEFIRCGQGGMVEVVVAVGVEKAVGEDGGSELHGLAEQRLQAAAGPRIAAGLDNFGVAESRIKAARPARKLGAHGQEFVGDEFCFFSIEAERNGGEVREERNDALPDSEALRWCARTSPGLAPDGTQALVVSLFVLPLLLWGVADRRWKRRLSAAIPLFHRLRNLRFDPRPTVALFHAVEGYETGCGRVPSATRDSIFMRNSRFKWTMNRRL